VRVEQDEKGRIVDPMGTVGAALRRLSERADVEKFIKKMLEVQELNEGTLSDAVMEEAALASLKGRRDVLPIRDSKGFNADDVCCPELSFLQPQPKKKFDP